MSGVRDQDEGKMGEELKPVTNVVKKDLISRQDAIEALDFKTVHMTAYHNGKCEGNLFAQYNKGLEDGIKAIRALPSEESERNIIRCADCKWWDRLEEGHPYGYCLACRSGMHTERWEISIHRQCKYDFFCADAEQKIAETDDDEVSDE